MIRVSSNGLIAFAPSGMNGIRSDTRTYSTVVLVAKR